MTLMNLCDGTRLTAHYDQVEEVHSMESSTPISVLPIGPPVILWHQPPLQYGSTDRITEQVACALIERSWPTRLGQRPHQHPPESRMTVLHFPDGTRLAVVPQRDLGWGPIPPAYYWRPQRGPIDEVTAAVADALVEHHNPMLTPVERDHYLHPPINPPGDPL